MALTMGYDLQRHLIDIDHPAIRLNSLIMPEALSPSIQHFSSGRVSNGVAVWFILVAFLDWKVASMFCLYVGRE